MARAESDDVEVGTPDDYLRGAFILVPLSFWRSNDFDWVTKRLYVHLLSYCNRWGRIDKVTQQRLREEMQMSQTTYYKCLNQLKDANLVAIHRRIDGPNLMYVQRYRGKYQAVQEGGEDSTEEYNNEVSRDSNSSTNYYEDEDLMGIAAIKCYTLLYEQQFNSKPHVGDYKIASVNLSRVDKEIGREEYLKLLRLFFASEDEARYGGWGWQRFNAGIERLRAKAKAGLSILVKHKPGGAGRTFTEEDWKDE